MSKLAFNVIGYVYFYCFIHAYVIDFNLANYTATFLEIGFILAIFS